MIFQATIYQSLKKKRLTQNQNNNKKNIKIKYIKKNTTILSEANITAMVLDPLILIRQRIRTLTKK